MPVQLTYPGVYIEEIPSGVRTIVGVATSITAFIGRTLRGPDNEPTIINSFADFERIFGGLWYDSALSYAVRDFYLNGGKQAIIVRLFNPLFATEQDKNAALDQANAQAQAAADAIFNAANNVGTNATASDVAKAAEKAIGGAGKDSPVAKDAATAVAKAAINATTPAHTPDGVAVAAEGAVDWAVEKKSGATSDADKAKAKQAATDVAKAARDAVTANPTPASVAAASKAKAKEINDKTDSSSAEKNAANAVDGVAQGAVKPSGQSVLDAIRIARLQVVSNLAKSAAPSLNKAQLVIGGLKLEAKYKGSWGNYLRVRIDYDNITEEAAKRFGLSQTDLFNLTVQDTNTKVTEKFLNVTTVTHPDTSRLLSKVLDEESKLVTSLELPPARPDQSPGKVKNGLDDTNSSGVEQEGLASDGADLTPKNFTDGGEKEGIRALDKADLFNILCIPPISRDNETEDDQIDVYQAALEYCFERRAMLIVDPLLSWSTSSASDIATSLTGGGSKLVNLLGDSARNAAIYFSRVKMLDPIRDNQVDTFVPCGIIAGIWARTDVQRGVWKAPAGLDASLTGIVGLQVNLDDDENGLLNPLGINCLRDFKILGRVVWGARTLRGADQLADEWKYIPVRRTALFIEESLFRGLQWVVFEPNDEPLWAQIRLNVGAFMHDLFVQGAFQGTTPQQAYFVKCDKETTTQSDINKGIVNIVVGFAPLKPAEFVVIKLQQIAGQIQT